MDAYGHRRAHVLWEREGKQARSVCDAVSRTAGQQLVDPKREARGGSAPGGMTHSSPMAPDNTTAAALQQYPTAVPYSNILQQQRSSPRIFLTCATISPSSALVCCGFMNHL